MKTYVQKIREAKKVIESLKKENRKIEDPIFTKEEEKKEEYSEAVVSAFNSLKLLREC